jgi:hypothetical protein
VSSPLPQHMILLGTRIRQQTKSHVLTLPAMPCPGILVLKREMRVSVGMSICKTWIKCIVRVGGCFLVFSFDFCCVSVGTLKFCFFSLLIIC